MGSGGSAGAGLLGTGFGDDLRQPLLSPSCLWLGRGQMRRDRASSYSMSLPLPTVFTHFSILRSSPKLPYTLTPVPSKALSEQSNTYLWSTARKSALNGAPLLVR